AGLGPAAGRLWAAITTAYELDEHEQALLVEAVRTVDLLEQLDEAIRRDGPLVESPQGIKAHPAAVEARQQRIALARLLAALRMPSGEEDSTPAAGRPQRRTGVRGTYRLNAA
ncbi:terminase, partial [Micromonospora noduli]|uniref:terminase n=1 Tax=Micromonospora noduli TaxID=709876 RepID=UPI00124B9FEC